MISPFNDDFCRRAMMDCVMHLILHSRKKLFGDGAVYRIIDGSSIDVSDFLVEAPFAGAYLLNFRNQMLKVVLIKNLSINQAVFV